MIKLCAYICLLSALSVVEMKPLNIKGRVGESVTFKCSDWDVWTGERSNVKYFCDSPCTDDKHVIIKAAYGKTTNNNRIELTNRAKGLSVTFTNLQKSDSKTYYCGVERPGFDLYVKVDLTVTDAVSSSPKTTPTTVISSSTMSSSSSDVITEMSTSYTTFYSTTPTASATQGAEYVPYLIAGLIFIFKVVMVGLILTRKVMKKQQNKTHKPTVYSGGS